MFRLTPWVRNPRRFFVRRSGLRPPARLVAALLPFCLLAPTLICGADSRTPQEAASACCRAMNFACHQRNTSSACCEHEGPPPPEVAVVSTVKKVARSQPLATIALFPVQPSAEAARQQGRELPSFFPGHSPPTDIPLFLLNSILLI
jgi:hypothetical protein